MRKIVSAAVFGLACFGFAGAASAGSNCGSAVHQETASTPVPTVTADAGTVSSPASDDSAEN